MTINFLDMFLNEFSNIFRIPDYPGFNQFHEVCDECNNFKVNLFLKNSEFILRKFIFINGKYFW